MAARALPEPLARPLARGVGLALAPAMRGRRAMLARHLERAHGRPLGPLARRLEVQRAFDSYARYWVESFRLPAMSAAAIDAGFTQEGFGHITGALDAGRGVIIALPHLGGWEFAGAWLSRVQGLPVTAVVEAVEPRELFEWFVGLRRSLGITVVPLGPDAGRAALGALRRNEILCLLSDRDIGGGGVEVEFFGERTTLPAGPATLALRTGAPILPTAVYFRGTRHHAVVRSGLDTSRAGRLREDVTRVTQDLAHALEDLIRVAPDQWHLLQPNWPSDR